MGTIFGILTVFLFASLSFISITSAVDAWTLYLICSYVFLILMALNYYLTLPSDDAFFMLDFNRDEFVLFKKYYLFFKYRGASEMLSQYINFTRIVLILVGIYLLINNNYIGSFFSIAFFVASSPIIFVMNPVIYLKDKKDQVSNLLLDAILSIQTKSNKNSDIVGSYKIAEENAISLEIEQKQKIYIEAVEMLFVTEIYGPIPNTIMKVFNYDKNKDDPIINAINDVISYMEKPLISKMDNVEALITRMQNGLARLVVEKKIELVFGIFYWSRLNKIIANETSDGINSKLFLIQIEYAAKLKTIRESQLTGN